MTKPQKQTEAKSGGAKRWLGIVLSLVVLILVVLLLSELEDTVDVQQTGAPPDAQPVSVEHLSVGPQKVEVVAYATVKPRWSAALRSAISGRVEQVFDSALIGEQVEAGTLLLKIEDSHYVAEVAAAELAVKEARLALSKAQKATSIARRQFKQDGKKPPNDLALHLPQLRIAEAGLQTAKARVAAAQKQLGDTRVKAPFAGFVTERYVSPGQTVNNGDTLLKLVDSATFELIAELGRGDWRLLQQPLNGATAQVLGHDDKPVAQAAIRRGGGFLDENTRQYKVFLVIENSADFSLLTGDFVRVVLPGIAVPKALSIPENALTQEGYLWSVDSDNRLRRTSPTVLFRRHDRIVVESPGSADNWRIAVTPLVSFLPGQQVNPLTVEN